MLTHYATSRPGEAQRDQNSLLISLSPCSSLVLLVFGKWPLHPAHLPSQTSWVCSAFSSPHVQWWSSSVSCILDSPVSIPSFPLGATAVYQVFTHLFFGPLKTFLNGPSASCPVLSIDLSLCCHRDSKM